MSFLKELSKRIEKEKTNNETTDLNKKNLLEKGSFIKKTISLKNKNLVINNKEKIENKDSEKNEIKKISKKNKRLKKEIIEEYTKKILNIIKDPYDKLILNKSTINKIFLNVKKDLDLYKKRDKKSKNSSKSSSNMINKEEIEKIISEAKKMGIVDEIIVLLFFKLGLKLFEISKLKIEDIDFNKGNIKIDDKTFEMDANTAAKIMAFIGSRTSGILLTNNNKPLSKDDLLNFIKRIMDAADIKKKDNIESLVDKFLNNLRKEGKPFMYWDYIDQVVELRSQEINKK